MSAHDTNTFHPARVASNSADRTHGRVGLDKFTLVLFSAAIFTSATLLFVVQPMVGKILLPMLGGAPSVWNTCMVFFQATLLAGYLTAHLLTRYVPLKFQAILFPLLLLAAMRTLPIAVGPEWSEQLLTGASPSWWLLLVLLANVAPVFFVMSMTSPLLQKWFARSGHPHSDDPYFLYAASNIGSILALLLYPLMIEVRLGVAQQAMSWMSGFGFFTILATACGLASWIGSHYFETERSATPTTGNSAAKITDRPLTWKRRAWWTLLAFVPSSLMLGVTTYISTDVSSIPLIWVVPLAMYLLTFVLAFSKRQIISAYWAGRIAALLILSITVTLVTGANEPQFLIVPMHLLMFFAVTLFCHQRLAADRPGTDHLTDFYLWLSVGGVLGGMFNALLAPSLFVTIIEYPLIMILASLLRETRSNNPQGSDSPTDSYGRIAVFGGIVFLGTIALSQLVTWVPAAWYDSLDAVQAFASVRLKTLVVFGLPAAWVLHQMENRARFSVGLLAILSVSLWQSASDSETLERDRNFYGTIATEKSELEQGTVVRMYHGNTVHGWQWTDEARRQIPLTYYGNNSGIGQAIASKADHQKSQNVGVIGLGTGTLAATLRSTDAMTIYEINPQVVDHAERYFTYLQDARDRGADLTLKHGDARLVLESEIRSNNVNLYDILAVDAFSSDSIPAHLLTNECLQIYLQHVKQDGILAFHVTNRYVNLEPVIGTLAKANGLFGTSCHFRHASGEEFDPETGEMACSWILLSRDKSVLERMEGKHLAKLKFDSTRRLWTDDYSNVISALEF